MRSGEQDQLVEEEQQRENEGISPQRAQRENARNSIAESNEQLITEAIDWKPLGLDMEGVTYVEGDDDGYADDESGYSGDDDGEMYGDNSHPGRGRGGGSMWAEDGSDIVWYEVIDAATGYPYWLHARSGVSQWEPPVWLDQIDATSGTCISYNILVVVVVVVVVASRSILTSPLLLLLAMAGHRYFVNNQNGMTQWERPHDFEVIARQDPEFFPPPSPGGAAQPVMNSPAQGHMHEDRMQTPEDERGQRHLLMSPDLVEAHTPVGALAAVRCRRKSDDIGMGNGMDVSSPAVTAW
jgi:hypothetical protein